MSIVHPSWPGGFPKGRTLCTCLLAGVVGHFGPAAEAQFLRLGPFDFTAKARTGAVWSDNIDTVRPSEQKAEPRDYYIYGGMDFLSETAFTGNGRLRLDTGFTIEKHFVRDDLNNSENPFGRFRAEAEKSIGHLDANVFYNWEHTSESADFVIPGVSSKTRNPKTVNEYGGGLEWKEGPLTLGTDYEFSQERFEKEEFKQGDVDTTTINYKGRWDFRDNLALSYESEHKREEYVNTPARVPFWDTTETIELILDSELWRHPRVTFSAGLEREDETGKKGKWEPIYEVRAEDEWNISPRLKLSGNALYSYERKYEVNDIAFTYDVRLEHEINGQARQKLKFSREPRKTFGSTEQTDTTTYSYDLEVRDVFIADLTLTYMISYEMRKPPTGLDENILSNDFALKHEVRITPRLTRGLKYTYEVEDSDIKSELLTENRVEWTYEYDL